MAAGTGIAGAAAIGSASERRDLPLASVPLIFGAQQAIEGALWLALASEDPSRLVISLATSFMFSALVVWPVWAPLAALLVERNRTRILAMAVIFVLAVLLALRGLGGMWIQPYGACVLQYSIAYGNGLPYSPLQFGGYVLCACGPFLLSSHRTLRIFGAIVFAGLIVSMSLRAHAYVSTWCFFAAAGSLTIYLHFARLQKQSAAPAALVHRD